MAWAILDTSVYIDSWTAPDGLDLDSVRRGFVIRHSSVVLSELRRGARTAAARALVDELRKLARAEWEPSSEDWWKCGALVRDIGDAHDWDVRKRREFQNDALIALTARRHGAVVVTTNRADFELLAVAIGVRLLVV